MADLPIPARRDGHPRPRQRRRAGRAAFSQDYGGRARTGYLHFSRQDGHQWPAGQYTLHLHMTTKGGQSLDVSSTVAVMALGREDLTPAVPPAASELRGTNRQPVR